MVKRIPVYALYGEELYRTDPGIVHVESIFERSSVNEWRIKPHLHNELVQILVVVTGGGEVQLGDFMHQLAARTCIFIPPGMVHGFMFQPATDGYVVTLKQSLLDAVRSESEGGFDSASAGVCYMADNRAVFDEVIHLTKTLRREVREHNQRNPSFCAAYGGLLLGVVLRECHRSAEALRPSSTQPDLARRFLAAVERDFASNRRVESYADELGVSNSSLHRLCRAELGLSPKDVIQARLIQEAKRRLIYTSETLEQIADKLGFSEGAYFSRFFKKHTSDPPRVFRKKYRDAV
jgi:AraC family transcriptional activator of pobA